VPVLANVDLGHTDPMVTLPLGIGATLDVRSRSVQLAEAATAG
jgi:muramoyltetrapeptide carboxypeptidase LdcA involved in peptidoglycan recycling